MDEDIKPSWLNLNHNKLHELLVSKGYPAPIMNNMLERVKVMKAERRKQRIKETVSAPFWREVLSPARAELGIVRTMKAQAKRLIVTETVPDELQKRLDTLNAYETVIVKTIERLVKVQKSGAYTPHQFAKELQEAGKLPLGGDGSHWPHFVSTKDKANIEAMFKKWADPARGKRKVPFEVRLSKGEHKRRKAALWSKIAEETQRTEQELSMATFDDDREELEKKLFNLRKAAFILEGLRQTAVVPNTWHGLL